MMSGGVKETEGIIALAAATPAHTMGIKSAPRPEAGVGRERSSAASIRQVPKRYVVGYQMRLVPEFQSDVVLSSANAVAEYAAVRG
jgi:hypothetical protein